MMKQTTKEKTREKGGALDKAGTEIRNGYPLAETAAAAARKGGVTLRQGCQMNFFLIKST